MREENSDYQQFSRYELRVSTECQRAPWEKRTAGIVVVIVACPPAALTRNSFNWTLTRSTMPKTHETNFYREHAGIECVTPVDSTTGIIENEKERERGEREEKHRNERESRRNRGVNIVRRLPAEITSPTELAAVNWANTVISGRTRWGEEAEKKTRILQTETTYIWIIPFRKRLLRFFSLLVSLQMWIASGAKWKFIDHSF